MYIIPQVFLPYMMLIDRGSGVEHTMYQAFQANEQKQLAAAVEAK